MITFAALEDGRLSQGMGSDEINRFFGTHLGGGCVVVNFADPLPAAKSDIGPVQRMIPEEWRVVVLFLNAEKASDFYLTNETPYSKWNVFAKPSDANTRAHAERYKNAASGRAKLLECISALDDHTISSHGADLAVVRALYNSDFEETSVKGVRGESIGVVHFHEPDGKLLEKWHLAILTDPRNNNIKGYFITNSSSPAAEEHWPFE